MLMRDIFEVDDVAYVVELTDKHHINLYIDVRASKKVVHQLTREESRWGDVSPAMLWRVTPTKSVFKVKAKVVEFVRNAIRRFNLYYFTFSANEDVKFAVYKRMAERFAKDLGYDLLIEGVEFKFFRR